MDEYKVSNGSLFDNKGAPPELVRLAASIIEEYETVTTIIFDAFIKDLKGNLGGFNPTTETIVIDMGMCVIGHDWMKKGIMYIPNVWFNLLYTLFHETAHAIQLADDPSLGVLDKLPEEYEREADDMADRLLIHWAKSNAIPTLNEMGWVGDQIKEVLNKRYAQKPEEVSEELDLEGTDAVANALHALLASNVDEEDRAVILEKIDKREDVGVIIKGRRYLTAYEAINVDFPGS